MPSTAKKGATHETMCREVVMMPAQLLWRKARTSRRKENAVNGNKLASAARPLTAGRKHSKLWAREGEGGAGGGADVVPSVHNLGIICGGRRGASLLPGQYGTWQTELAPNRATRSGLVIRPKITRRLPQSCVGVFAQDGDGEMPTNRLSDSTRPLFATNARHAGVPAHFVSRVQS